MALGPFYVADKLKGATGMRGIALFMRHGETAWNREGRVMGRNPIELDERGRAQVQAAIPFARLIKPELIVTSPLARARQSAEIIAAGVGGIPVTEDPQLSEVLYGRWEGMVYDDLVEDADYAELSRSSAGRADSRWRDDRAGAIARRRGGAPCGRSEQRPANPVRLARRHHPHRLVPFHATGTRALPADPRGQRGLLGFPARSATSPK